MPERDAEIRRLASEAQDEARLNRLPGLSVTYRIAVGPQQGRKEATLESLPACDPEDRIGDSVGKAVGLLSHAGGGGADERQKIERLCRYISRPAVSAKRLSLTPSGNVGYPLKTPYGDGTTHVIFEPLDLIARRAALVPMSRIPVVTTAIGR